MSEPTDITAPKDLTDFETFVTELPTLLLKHTPEEMGKFVLAVRLNTIPVDMSAAKTPIQNLWDIFVRDDQPTIRTVRSSSFCGENLDEILTKIGDEFLKRKALVGGLTRSTSPFEYYRDLKCIIAGTISVNGFSPVFVTPPDRKILPLLQDPQLGSQLSIGSKNELLNSGVTTFAQLLGRSVVDYLRELNFGRQSMNELNVAFDALILERLGKLPSLPLIDSRAPYRPLFDFSPFNVRQQIQSFVEELDKQPDYAPPIDDQIKPVSPVLSMNFNLASFQRMIANDSGRCVWYRLPFAEATLNVRIFVDIARDAGNAFNAEIDFKQRVAVDSNGKLSGIFGRTVNGEIHLHIEREGDNFTLVLTERAATPA